MTTTERQSPRRRWIWITAAAAGALLLVGAGTGIGIYAASRPSGDPQATPQPTTSTPAVAGVDACMGGAKLTADAVIDAQLSAPRTPEGAVSYAAAFARYTLQIPTPTDSGAVASTTGLGVDWWSHWSESGLSWTGPNPVGVTTVNGSYRVDSFTSDEAVITLTLPWVIDGAISPSRTFEPTLTLSRSAAGTWSVSDMGSTGSGTASSAADTPFTGGC